MALGEDKLGGQAGGQIPPPQIADQPVIADVPTLPEDGTMHVELVTEEPLSPFDTEPGGKLNEFIITTDTPLDQVPHQADAIVGVLNGGVQAMTAEDLQKAQVVYEHDEVGPELHLLEQTGGELTGAAATLGENFQKGAQMLVELPEKTDPAKLPPIDDILGGLSQADIDELLRQADFGDPETVPLETQTDHIPEDHTVDVPDVQPVTDEEIAADLAAKQAELDATHAAANGAGDEKAPVAVDLSIKADATDADFDAHAAPIQAKVDQERAERRVESEREEVIELGPEDVMEEEEPAVPVRPSAPPEAPSRRASRQEAPPTRVPAERQEEPEPAPEIKEGTVPRTRTAVEGQGPMTAEVQHRAEMGALELETQPHTTGYDTLRRWVPRMFHGILDKMEAKSAAKKSDKLSIYLTRLDGETNAWKTKAEAAAVAAAGLQERLDRIDAQEIPDDEKDRLGAPLRAELDRIGKEMRMANDEVGGLTARRQEALASLKALEFDRDRAVMDVVAKYDVPISTHSERLDQLKAERAPIAAEVEQYKQDVADLLAKMRKLQKEKNPTRRAMSEDVIWQINKEVTALNKEQNKLERRLAEIDKEMVPLEGTIRRLKRERDTYAHLGKRGAADELVEDTARAANHGRSIDETSREMEAAQESTDAAATTEAREETGTEAGADDQGPLAKEGPDGADVVADAEAATDADRAETAETSEDAKEDEEKEEGEGDDAEAPETTESDEEEPTDETAREESADTQAAPGGEREATIGEGRTEAGESAEEAPRPEKRESKKEQPQPLSAFVARWNAFVKANGLPEGIAIAPDALDRKKNHKHGIHVGNALRTINTGVQTASKRASRESIMGKQFVDFVDEYVGELDRAKEFKFTRKFGKKKFDDALKAFGKTLKPSRRRNPPRGAGPS